MSPDQQQYKEHIAGVSFPGFGGLSSVMCNMAASSLKFQWQRRHQFSQDRFTIANSWIIFQQLTFQGCYQGANIPPAVINHLTLSLHSFQSKRKLFSNFGREAELVAGFARSTLAKAVEETLGALEELALKGWRRSANTLLLFSKNEDSSRLTLITAAVLFAFKWQLSK